MNVKTTKAIVCSNIHDNGNPYYTETTHLIRTANQLIGFFEIKGITTWSLKVNINIKVKT